MNPTLGATHLGGGRTEFLVWAPRADRVEVRLLGDRERWVPLSPGERGYHHASVEGACPGRRYFYRMGGERERPDPASRFQPEGVHGPSEIIDSNFAWMDSAWKGLPLEQFIHYEIHIGTFTAQGTLAAVIPRLDDLKDLGITAIELMPVAQFPGERNWGYDGVFPFAVQNSYGGPLALKKLVNACHTRGMALVLDVVYNHLGPEGNYLADFGPYFTDSYRTPWGPAVNYDQAESDEVRRYFIENALYWVTEFHIDGLRLDAVHAIVDPSARPFLQELGEAVHRRARELQRQVWVIPESNRNDARMVRAQEAGGLGLDAQWSDDFHHALHTLLTDEKSGYYVDFGKIDHLARALTDGFVYSDEYSAYRRRRHGSDSRDIPAHRFVVCAQNHDQVGNRMLGERLSQLVSIDGLKLAAGTVLLSPFVPLLFMGEEYGERAPFLYFIHHSDPGLVEAVRKGRREEFSRFHWRGEIPDPQDESTFLRCKLNYELHRNGKHRILREFYKELIRLRKELPSLAHLSKADMEVAGFEAEKTLYVRRWNGSDQALAVYNFSDAPAELRLPLPSGEWRKHLDSADVRWGGGGSSIPNAINSPGTSSITISPKSLVLFHAD